MKHRSIVALTRNARASLGAVLGLIAILGSLAACAPQDGSTGQQSTRTATKVAATATATPTPVGVSVQGTQVYSQGHPITLIGVNRSSLEYSCAGDDHLTLAVFQTMRQWGINAVRIPTSSEFWANAGGDCPNYHKTVQQVVANARAAHLFVILDLQWSAPFDTPNDQKTGGVQCPMPDTGKDAAMWQDVARLYHNDTGVLFDLYGEPHDVSWYTWFHGGTVTQGCYIIGGPTTEMEHGNYQAIGMSALVQQIRAIAPNNVLVVGGTTWGYDLSGIRNGFALADTNILYDTHPFNYSNKQPYDWYRAFGHTSLKYPVIASEFGSYDCDTGYIGQAIDYFTAHHISWLAWSWQSGSCAGPSLLADWTGAPSVPYGSYIRQRMLAVTAAQG